VKAAGSESLQGWLHFDASTHTFSGVPFPEDASQPLYVSVTVQGEDGSEVSDIFAIQVARDEARSDAVSVKDAGQAMSPIRCPVGSSVTKATIVVDADPAAVSERLALIQAMAEHLDVPVNILRLLPMDNLPLLDSAALVAGPGDVKEPLESSVGIEWQVGCGNVQAAHMLILTAVEASSGDGSMSKALGRGVV
jgi:hypothetical protein